MVRTVVILSGAKNPCISLLSLRLPSPAPLNNFLNPHRYRNRQTKAEIDAAGLVSPAAADHPAASVYPNTGKTHGDGGSACALSNRRMGQQKLFRAPPCDLFNLKEIAPMANLNHINLAVSNVPELTHFFQAGFNFRIASNAAPENSPSC